MNVSNGTSTCDGKQFCQITLKSIQNCRSDGPDKFEQMQAWIHKHTPNCPYDNFVSLTASGLNNNGQTMEFVLETVLNIMGQGKMLITFL